MKPWVFNRHFLSKPTEPQEVTPMVVESLDTPAPSTSRFRDAFHPVQFGIFPNRLLLPHHDDEMISGSEEAVSSIRDGYTVGVKVDLVCILERHLVNLNSSNPTFREAQDRRHSSPNPECFNNDVPIRLREQRKLSILTWNLGPRRGKEGAIDKHITGKWHIIALQGAMECLLHECLTSHVAVLFNKDTFHSDSKVTSVYLHDTRDRPQVVKGRQSGWVLEAVILHHSKGYRATANRSSPWCHYVAWMFVNLNTDHGYPRGGILFTKSELGETNPWPW